MRNETVDGAAIKLGFDSAGGAVAHPAALGATALGDGVVRGGAVFKLRGTRDEEREGDSGSFDAFPRREATQRRAPRPSAPTHLNEGKTGGVARDPDLADAAELGEDLLQLGTLGARGQGADPELVRHRGGGRAAGGARGSRARAAIGAALCGREVDLAREARIAWRLVWAAERAARP